MHTRHTRRIVRRVASGAIALLFIAASSPASAQRTDAAPADTSGSAIVSGIVYDSLGARPLAGAAVQIVDTVSRGRVYNARSDSAGRFTIANVRPGEYFAGFFHSSLDALGVTLPATLVSVTSAGTPLVTLAVPGASRILPVVCGARAPNDSSGAMAGAVRDVDTGLPIANATVVATWNEVVIDAHGLRSIRRRVPITTRDDGTYLACNLPGDDDVIVTADAHGFTTGLVGVHIPAIGVVWRDLALGDSTSVTTMLADSANTSSERLLRGTAQLSGMVRTPDGKPARSARVLVWGTGLTTASREDGRFTLTGLPAGTFSVEARAIGFEPVRVAVDLSDKSPNVVTLTLEQHVQELKAVTVYGKKPGRSSITDFLERRQHGLGHYITAQDLQQHPVIAISDAFRMTPGLHVVPGTTGNSIVGRGNCTPSVYLNGMQVIDGASDIDNLVSPMDVAGIEVYDETTTPPQYRTDACGAVLIWTK